MRHASTALPNATPYALPARQALLAEALGCITAGRPLPEGLRPVPTAVGSVATVREGIERILLGHCPRPG